MIQVYRIRFLSLFHFIGGVVVNFLILSMFPLRLRSADLFGSAPKAQSTD